MKDIYKLKSPVYIVSSAAVTGHEEYNGPLGESFDLSLPGDDTFGCESWEQAESELVRMAVGIALSKALLCEEEIDILLAGDLLNQCISSAFGLSKLSVPFLGLYGACSTAAEGLLIASLLASAYSIRTANAASSHNAAAERQFRSPLEYAGQRPPTAQWTVTGSGAFILSPFIKDAEQAILGAQSHLAVIDEVCPGRMVDAGIDDANNMGAAMAPAAADTLLRYFSAGGKIPSLILTGDLGYEGGEIFLSLMESAGHDISKIYNDCGLMIYSREKQDKHAGGSGCGCSAAVLACRILNSIKKGELDDVLFLGTGALMNTMSIQQGLTIPAIAHLVHIKGERRFCK